jgi:glucose/mannose-6-phosphate isomerase
MTALTLARTRSASTVGLLADVLSIPEHCATALWRFESAAGLMEEPGTRRGGLSSPAWAYWWPRPIGAGLARAILGDHAARPDRGQAAATGWPPWATPDTTGPARVVLGQHRGDPRVPTSGAGIVGARRVVVTSGGRLAEQARADGVPVIPIPAASSRARRSPT